MLTGCGDTASTWQDNYPPALQGIVDADAAAKDCTSLQATFDTWDAAKDLGGKADLLTYVDAALSDAGCY